MHGLIQGACCQCNTQKTTKENTALCRRGVTQGRLYWESGHVFQVSGSIHFRMTCSIYTANQAPASLYSFPQSVDRKITFLSRRVGWNHILLMWQPRVTACACILKPFQRLKEGKVSHNLPDLNTVVEINSFWGLNTLPDTMWLLKSLFGKLKTAHNGLRWPFKAISTDKTWFKHFIAAVTV